MSHIGAVLPEIEQEYSPVTTEPNLSTEAGPKISHAVLLTAAQLLRGVGRMLFVVVSARVLGPETFGVYALLFAMIEMLAVASGSGYMDYITREAARDEYLGWGLGAQLTWLRVALATALAGGCLGFLGFLGYHRSVLTLAAWFALTLIPRSLTETVQGVLRGTHRYFQFLAIEISCGLGLLAGTILLLVRGGGLSFVIATELVASGAAFLAALFFMLRFRTRQRTSLGLRQLVKASTIFNIYAFVGNLYDRLDVVLLSKLAGNYATGIYSAAYRPIGTVQLLPYGILYSLLPALSRGECSQAERARLEKAMGLLLCSAFFLVFITMVFADPLVPLVYGVRFAQSAAALKLLIWAVAFRYLNYALNIVLLAARRERVFVITSLVCLGVNLIGNFIFIPMFSWQAAAVLTTVTEAVLFAQNVFWLRRVFGTVPKPFGWFRNSLAFLVLLAAAMFGAKLAAPLLIGSTCIVVFAGYLFWSGTIGAFRAVWRPNARACDLRTRANLV